MLFKQVKFITFHIEKQKYILESYTNKSSTYLYDTLS